MNEHIVYYCYLACLYDGSLDALDRYIDELTMQDMELGVEGV